MDIKAVNRATRVKALAKEFGFMSCGIATAGFLDEEAPLLEKWLNQNRQGDMKWMENHFDKRLDPTKLVEGSKSVISFALNYYPESQLTGNKKISKYAYGRDYHKVIKGKLKHLIQRLKEEFGDINGRAFVDSAPVMDKAWAQKAGIGWIGKNSNLISKTQGSFFFLAELITDLELAPDQPTADHCGTCTACVDACPTDAIYEPYAVDGSKCISYLTIELKDRIPEEFKGKMDNWAFGCDICQDVCPWNRFSTPTQEQDFTPKEEFSTQHEKDWQEITEDVFSEIFKGSAVSRTKWSGFKRNLDFLE